MTKKSNKTSPNMPGSNDRALANTNYSRDEKKVSLEIQYDEFLGEKIPYVYYEGKKRYPVNAVGRLLGYDGKHETQLFERNKEILKGNAYPLKLRGKQRATSVWCVDSIGLLILTGRANLEDLSPERQETVIKIVQFMAESADMRLKGELVPAPSALTNPRIQDLIESSELVAKAVGCDVSTVLTAELAIVENQTGQKIGCSNILPLHQKVKKASVFTETELGKKFHVTGRKIQIVLKGKGYLQSIGGRVDFTHVGLLYGEWRPGIEFKGKPRTMVRMRRFWNQDIIPKLEEHFYYVKKSDEGIFTGHIGMVI